MVYTNHLSPVYPSAISRPQRLQLAARYESWISNAKRLDVTPDLRLSKKLDLKEIITHDGSMVLAYIYIRMYNMTGEPIGSMYIYIYANMTGVY